MEQLTTYRAKGKEIGLVFLFKYDLNGAFSEFKLEEGKLNENQIKWLFTGYLPAGTDFENLKDLLSKLKTNFPASESIMRNVWMKDPKYTKVFTVEKFVADISFEAFWKIWDLKVKREHSEKAWNKLKESEQIKCFLNFKKYQDHLIKTGQAKAHLVTWLNQKRFNDEY